MCVKNKINVPDFFILLLPLSVCMGIFLKNYFRMQRWTKIRMCPFFFLLLPSSRSVSVCGKFHLNTQILFIINMDQLHWS